MKLSEEELKKIESIIKQYPKTDDCEHQTLGELHEWQIAELTKLFDRRILDANGGEKLPEVYQEVLMERSHQDAKWGQQNHIPVEWIAILVEEVGEASQCAVNAHFPKSSEPLKEYRKELIQVAAVAIAMIECLDRNSQ